MNIGFGAQRHLYDLAAAIRRGDCAAASTALDLFAREKDGTGYARDSYAEVIACGRASVHARPKHVLLKAA